jgi:hypothetical protein
VPLSYVAGFGFVNGSNESAPRHHELQPHQLLSLKLWQALNCMAAGTDKSYNTK